MTDIFTEARFKIALLYFLSGIVIFSVAGYAIYSRTLGIVQGVVVMIQQAVAQHAAGIAVGATSTTDAIAQSVNAQVQQMNLTVGLWVILAMLFSAYVVAGIMLFPIKRAMEKQRRFIADVAHELRTPLSVMKLEAEVTLLDEAGATRDELLTAMKSNLEEVNRMARTSQFLLDFAHLESRLSKITFTEMDLVTTVASRVKFMQPIATEKQVSLTFSSTVSEAAISGSAVAVEEMVMNLMKNAIAYTPVGGKIVVAVRVERGAPSVSVADDGIGIPPADLPNIFEPFYRGGNAFSQRSKRRGTGLGLAIVKEIATIHEARISVRSELGKGTEVTIRFPTLS